MSSRAPVNSTTFKMGNLGGGGSLVIQGLRIYLSMQGDADLIPAQGTKILHTAATQPTHSGTRVAQQEKPPRREACAPQWRPSTAKIKKKMNKETNKTKQTKQRICIWTNAQGCSGILWSVNCKHKEEMDLGFQIWGLYPSCPIIYSSVHAKSLQSCLTLCDPVDCSPPGSSIRGVLQARILPPGDLPSLLTESTLLTSLTLVGRFFTTCTTWAAPFVYTAPPLPK